MAWTEAAVTACLKKVIDPEWGINIVDLGLIYRIDIEESKISVDMTLTAPGSPTVGRLAGGVEQALCEGFEDAEIEVSLVWEPLWTLDRLSEAAKAQLDDPRSE